MESNLRTRISAFLKDHDRRSRWHKIVTGLGCVVVFCTVYALILPAITMTKETVCGLEEHIHTEDCYMLETNSPQLKFSCGSELEEYQFVLHIHDELCYGDEGELICPLEELEEHEHAKQKGGEYPLSCVTF